MAGAARLAIAGIATRSAAVAAAIGTVSFPVTIVACAVVAVLGIAAFVSVTLALAVAAFVVAVALANKMARGIWAMLTRNEAYRGPVPIDASRKRRIIRVSGWGGRIRTYGTRYQKPLPYHLATPQR